MDGWSRLWLLGFLLTSAGAFAPSPGRMSTMRTFVAPTCQLSFRKVDYDEQSCSGLQSSKIDKMKKVLDRFDTLKSAGLVDSNSPTPLLMRGPGFKRIAFWLFVGFMWKWYRARFINKIPVWDRQPQWNMVVTNREQEKELKAYTCKNCGSTLFIARNREWFFKGDTGLAGLGCFTCGAKGEDNFVMDRDRIVEDVGDDDDYFDYERPLDFVTAAERRALLKKVEGDEDAANQMLIDQAAGTSAPPEGAVDAEIETTTEEMKKEQEETSSGEEETQTETADEGERNGKAIVDDAPKEGVVTSETTQPEEAPKKKKKKKKKKSKPKENLSVEAVSKEPKKPESKASPSDDFDFDALGMDDFMP